MLEQHPLGKLFPAMSAEEYEHAEADIRKHGQREPIILLDGLVLDGWHRHRKWTPFARPKNCRRALLSSPRDFGCHRPVTNASQDDDNRNHPPSCTLIGVRFPND